ncbi:Or9e6 [Eciton burchellii]|nr:Or9e6 [Eciton burchellii]
MEPNLFRFYDIMKKIVSLTGQWPYQRRRVRLFRLTIINVFLLSGISPQIGYFIHCEEYRQCIITIMPSVFLIMIIVVKLYTYQFNSSKIKYLMDCLLSDWQRLESPKEYEIMETYAANGRRLSLMFSFCCCTTCFLFTSSSLIPHLLDIILPLNESRPILLPYPSYYFVDERKYFVYIFLHVSLAAQVCMTAILTHDCTVLTYTEHVCSIFAVTGFRFENLSRHVNQSHLINCKSDSLYNEKIILFVQMHQRALQFAEFLENTFTITFAIQVMISTVWISITLLQIMLQSDNVLEVIRYVGFIIAQFIHLFFFSMQGQKMIDHSLQVCDKIYSSLWYKIPVKSQKLLLYVMRRSLQANFLSAGKIYVFSLRSFTVLLQTSLSYFTVLASF